MFRKVRPGPDGIIDDVVNLLAGTLWFLATIALAAVIVKAVFT